MSNYYAAPTITNSKYILWADDNPSSNALEISQLEDRGFTVFTANCTRIAMEKLKDIRFGVIVSDTSRYEDGKYDTRAGLAFLKAARSSGYQQPFIIYSPSASSAKLDMEVKALGGDGVTSSPVEMLEWIETRLGSPKAQNF